MAKDTAVIAPDDVAAEMRRLGAELQAVADDSVARTAKLREVEAFLGKLSLKDYPDLAESPVIQGFVRMFADPATLKPGQARNAGTLAEVVRDWTFKDLEQFDTKTFTPAESLPLTWNGLTIYIYQDVECTVPEPFYRLYQEHREAIRQAQVHERYLLGKGPPPHPNWLTAESARVRAFTNLGAGHLGVGPIAEGEAPEGTSG